jgi:hypothetical protein
MKKVFERFYWIKKNGNIKSVCRERALHHDEVGKRIVWCCGDSINFLRTGFISIIDLKAVIERFEKEKTLHSKLGEKK